MFICLEGGDNVGKTTIAKELASALTVRYEKPVIITSEPDQKTKQQLTNPELTGLQKLLLINFNRIHHLSNIIIPAIRRGEIVICDRFFYSTLCYQPVLDDVSPDLVYLLHNICCNDIMPDYNFLVVRHNQKGTEDCLDKLYSQHKRAINNSFQNLSDLGFLTKINNNYTVEESISQIMKKIILTS